MNIGDSFRRLGSANVSMAKALVEKLTDESWYQDSPHHFAESSDGGVSVMLLVHDTDLRHDKPTKQPALKVFARAIRPILAITADYFDGSDEGRDLTVKYGPGFFVRARLLRITMGSVFSANEDISHSEMRSHRVHVPIVSNDKVRFRVGNEALTLPEGEIFEVNNLRRRHIENNGDADCVHLVLDYVLDRQPAE